MRKRRAFARDEYLGIRMPREDKSRLTQLACRRRRDTSNLALELICAGMDQLERQMGEGRAALAAR